MAVKVEPSLRCFGLMGLYRILLKCLRPLLEERLKQIFDDATQNGLSVYIRMYLSRTKANRSLIKSTLVVNDGHVAGERLCQFPLSF